MSDKLPKKIRATVELLNLKATPPLPVKVVTGKPEGAHATVEVRDSKFLITLDRSLTSSISQHFLVHEWAHCLCWTGGSLLGEHSLPWAIVYARLYSLVFED
ncbi:MAG: hypothetical protein Unbinned767contig1000_16 [Prokaryotic dsDNA virus sp.]|nr:MAG: hypothetical protein Unbinned767contig1000_16 [Prokaryotic dsDNA virus sp.]